MRVLANADVSLENSGKDEVVAREVVKGKLWNGSQMSREKGSKMLLRRPPKMLGMIDILCYLAVSLALIWR